MFGKVLWLGFGLLFGLISSAVAEDCPAEPGMNAVYRVIYNSQSTTGELVEEVRGYATVVDRRGVLLTAAHVVGSFVDESTGREAELLLKPVVGNSEAIQIDDVFSAVSEDWALLYASGAATPFGEVDVAQEFFDHSLSQGSLLTRDRPIITSSQAPHALLGQSIRSDVFQCKNPLGLLIRATPYDFGDSGAAVVNHCGRLVAVTSAFSQTFKDDDVLASLGPSLLEIGRWADSFGSTPKLPAGQKTVEDFIESIGAEGSGVASQEPSEAFRQLRTTMGEMDVIVATPAICAMGALARRMLDSSVFPLPETELSTAMRQVGSPGSSLSSIVGGLSGADSVSWIEYLELFSIFRELSDTATIDSESAIALELSLATLAQKSGLLNLYVMADNGSQFTYKATDAEESTIAEFLTALGEAKSVSAVESAIFNPNFDRIVIAKPDDAILEARSVLTELQRASVFDDGERQSASLRADVAIGHLLSGLQAAVRVGEPRDSKYITRAVTDLALLIQRRRQLFATFEVDRQAHSRAERWLVRYVLSKTPMDDVAWGMIFRNFEDFDDPVNAWFMRSAEMLVQCVRGRTECLTRAKIRARTSDIIALDFGSTASASCRNKLDIALSLGDDSFSEEWLDFEESVGVPRLQETYRTLREAELGGTLQEAKAAAVEQLGQLTSAMVLLPFPCAPIILSGLATQEPSSTPNEMSDWIALATASLGETIPKPGKLLGARERSPKLSRSGEMEMPEAPPSNN